MIESAIALGFATSMALLNHIPAQSGAAVAFPNSVFVAPAELPEGARSGHVVLLFVVTPSGDVMYTMPLAGEETLRGAAQEALRRWRFATGQRFVTGVVSIGVGVPDGTPPQLLTPILPAEAMQRREGGGVVVVQVMVAPSGTAESAQAVGGPPALWAAATDLVRHARYPRAALPYSLTVSVRVEPDR